MCETYRFQHSEVMRMPFRTFLAYSRLSTVRARNKSLASRFEG